MKKQEITKQEPKKSPEVINMRDSNITSADKVVYFVEVGDMSNSSYQSLLTDISNHWNSNKDINGQCIVIPVRNGCLKNDILYNDEILNFVRTICEVKDNEIVFKENFRELKVVRTLVGL